MDDETIHRRRWGILAVLVLCLLVVILDNTILNVALKTIQEDLHASQTEMQWAVDAYILVFAGLLITWGVLGDRLGRKKILLTGLVLFGSMSALCSFSGSSHQLILFRALMGIGAAAVQPQTLSIIQNVFSPEERPKAIGIWAGASGMAIALGPITGGILLKYFAWGSIFLVNVPIVIVAIIGITILVPESRNPKPGRLDPLGVVLSIVALVVLVYGVIQGGNSNHWLEWDTAGAIVAGLALLALFVWTQSRSSHPTIDVSLFRNRAFSAGTVAITTSFFALQGATFYLAYYLQAVRGFSPLRAGLMLIAVAVAVMTMAPLSARFTARFGPAAVVSTGLTIFGLALCSYAFVSPSTSLVLVGVILFATGSGMGLTMSPATNAIMGAVPRERAGAGSAVNNTVRQVGGALGVAVLGSILAVLFRGHLGADAPRDLAQRLDQPAGVVATLPASQRVTPLVRSDTSQSIGDALPFALQARDALQARAAAQGGAAPAAVAQARTELGGFVASVRSSFMSAMHLTSVIAGLFAFLGAALSRIFLPGRRRGDDEVAHLPQHLDAGAAPVPAHADHRPKHAEPSPQASVAP